MNFGGVPIGGFEGGTFVSIVKSTDTWSGKDGIGGEAMMVKNNSGLWTVALTLMANSASNDYLSAIYLADLNLTGVGLLPLNIKNNLGRELFSTSSATVTKMTDINFSNAGEPKTWNFLCYKAMLVSAGGH